MTMRNVPMTHRRLLPAIAVGIAMLAAACSSDTTTDDAGTDPATTDTSVDDSTVDSAAPEDAAPDDATSDDAASDGVGPVDITNTVLTSTATACTDHAGTYVAEVTDVSSDTAFMGETTITDNGDGTCTLATNSIPNHDISVEGQFAHQISEVPTTYEISATPVMNDEPSPLDFQANAVLLNGVIWEAYPAACFGVGNSDLGREAVGCGGNQLDNPWRYNVGSNLNRFRTDAYHAHTQPTGLYHYHGSPLALYDADCADAGPSPVIGFARDGFPVFGPCLTDESGQVRTARSSYQLKSGIREDIAGFTTPYAVGNVQSDEYNGQFIGDFEYIDGLGDLDECNGMLVGDTYGYVVTDDYPYVLSCYRGNPSTSFGLGR